MRQKLAGAEVPGMGRPMREDALGRERDLSGSEDVSRESTTRSEFRNDRQMAYSVLEGRENVEDHQDGEELT